MDIKRRYKCERKKINPTNETWGFTQGVTYPLQKNKEAIFDEKRSILQMKPGASHRE